METNKKSVTLAQVLESFWKSEALATQIAQAVNGELEGKQDKLTGTAGQVVGFNAQGQAVAQTGFSAAAFMFSVSDDGHLLYSYTGADPQSFYIDSRGHLCIDT